jgi:hypothetical protein
MTTIVCTAVVDLKETLLSPLIRIHALCKSASRLGKTCFLNELIAFGILQKENYNATETIPPRILAGNHIQGLRHKKRVRSKRKLTEQTGKE